VGEVPGSELEIIFKQLPLLSEFRIEDFQIRPLPGYTNQNFHLKNDQHDWVLRIPKPQTNLYINRQHEAHNIDRASRLGIVPERIWCNESGLSLSVTLLNSRSINKNDLDNKSILSSLIETICRLHKSKKIFLGKVDLTDLIKRYYALAPERCQRQIDSSYKMALDKLEQLSNREIALVPSHNDLVLENILIDTANKIWIIDWEYASMASPYWDVATLCNAANFNQVQCAWVLDEYKNHSINLDPEILFDYRYMLGVLSICWMAAFTEVDIEDEIRKLNK